MREWSTEPVGTAVAAFITTIHCALTLLRNYRSKNARLAVLPSIVFLVSPWFLSSPFWLATGLLVHAGWFAACERFLPKSVAERRAPSPATAAPRKAMGFQPLEVLATIAETAEIRTFRLARPEGFTFKPGQFAMVRVSVNGTALTRCYSITSAPSATGYLEISVRNQGVVSRSLHETVRPGTTLEVNGPGGAFVYPGGDQPIVLLAGGIGITPLLSMLRHGLASEPSREITLILSAKTVGHVPFLDELRVLERRHPRFRLAVALSQDSAELPFVSGRVDRQLIERTVPTPRKCVYLICGPLPMIDAMRSVLSEIGVPPAQVHFEKFEAAVSLANTDAPPARLTLRKSKRTLDVAPGQTILDAAGTAIPSLCRVGVCGTCRTRLISGDVEGDFDAIDASEQAEGFILACVARPNTDCVIDV